jgi:ubiquinone/menaquinone biosynthesis C-methylase UbiE
MGTTAIYQTALQIAQKERGDAAWRRHLDIGAGRGELVSLFREAFKTESWVSDYTQDLMKVPGQKVDVVNLNQQGLPYEDGFFDVVTATEVIEHLEHYRETLREIYRVLKPGGIAILSTPNILNLNSRLRFLWFGYWNLFGPLPVKNSALYSTGGHINPVSAFYVQHSMLDAGFTSVAWGIDRVQRSSILKLAVLYLPIRFFGALAWRKEVKRYKTIDEANAPLVRSINHSRMLLGRTVFVWGRKG